MNRAYMTQSLKLILIFCVLAPFSCIAQLSVEDHLGMESVSSLHVHNSKIIYAKRTKESWDGPSTSSIIISNLDGSELSALTSDEYDYDPKWSPQGNHVSFISYRNNLQQIYVIPTEGGGPKIASDAQYYLSGYDWLDGKTLVYVDDEPRDSVLIATEKENGGGYVVGTEFYTNAAWTYNIENGSKTKITNGSFRIMEICASPDGSQIAIIGSKNYDMYESITNNWVRVIDIENGNSVYEFNGANSMNNIGFSPDGQRISFAGSTEGYASNDALYIVDLASGKAVNHTYDIDPTVEHIDWLDAENLIFSTPKDGYTALYQLNINGKSELVTAPYRVIYDLEVEGDDMFYFAATGTRTNQLYQQSIGDSPDMARQLTNLNPLLVSKINTSSSVLTYRSYDGTTVQGIMNYPSDFDSTQSYPLMVIPHGGPDAVVLDDFNWMGQFFADNGYVVFRPNFRGSIGYGRDFYAGNRNAFGDTDFQDIMAGVDKLIEMGAADESQMVIAGWSYGGYMANWAITQTDRFKAAISVAGVSNWVSMYGQHEFSNRDLGMWEYEALLIDAPENYRRPSPIFHVKQANTPLLILHGGNDNRSPTLQAWEMYRAMKDADKEVEMIIYPRAGHSISNPLQFKSVLTNWLAWADKHIGKK